MAQPEKKFSAGAIQAAIWDNEGVDSQGKKTSYKTITLQRVYKDKQGNWQNTSTMRISDLPKAELVVRKAYEYLSLRQDMESIEEEILPT